jgi:hypothetical protein
MPSQLPTSNSDFQFPSFHSAERTFSFARVRGDRSCVARELTHTPFPEKISCLVAIPGESGITGLVWALIGGEKSRLYREIPTIHRRNFRYVLDLKSGLTIRDFFLSGKKLIWTVLLVLKLGSLVSKRLQTKASSCSNARLTDTLGHAQEGRDV